MHHPEDVIIGSIIGIVCAYIIMYMGEHSVEKVSKQKDNELSPEMFPDPVVDSRCGTDEIDTDECW